jgi:hypothetical protein
MSDEGQARERELATHEAYDVAYDLLYTLLPDCRGKCLCRFGA